jgi:hypothetical protein
MDDWTPSESAEWKARYEASAPGSQERALLEDMQWTGIFMSEQPGSPVQYYTATEPPSPPTVPAPPLPPLHPPPSPTGDPDKVLAAAERDAFYNQKRRLSVVEKQGILEKAKMQGKIPEGIASRTRREVPRLGSGRMKTRKAKKGGEIVTTFFNIRDQIKLYHWQTKSFAEHKATDDLVGTLDTNIDKFVETYMGRYGRPYVKRTLPMKNLTVTGIRAFIGRSDEWLTNKLPRMLKKTDSDLLNIRDEILADLNQVKYLFTLS